MRTKNIFCQTSPAHSSLPQEPRSAAACCLLELYAVVVAVGYSRRSSSHVVEAKKSEKKTEEKDPHRAAETCGAVISWVATRSGL